MNDSLPTILGEDPIFLDAVERCSKLATINRSCLVVGERGTGKELFAARLHYLSPRWNGPLVKINCAALSETLLESELFGHEMGAFTGATKRRAGRFELAHMGTLILDEIASASGAVQEKVLRVIEYGEFERVGGTDTLKVDVRVVGSANVDLPSLVEAGDFRADLLDRLAFDVITIPPLRARPGDILPLANNFALDVAKDLELDHFPGFSERAEQTLRSHDWPGNVRELKNAVGRSIFYEARDGEHGEHIDHVVVDPFQSPWRPVAIPQSNKVPQMPPNNSEQSFNDAVTAYEISLLQNALEHSRHNQKQAANALDLGYHQFRRLIHKHGLKT